MGKALVIIAIASIVAIVAMAGLVWSMMDHREHVELNQDILATKAAEAREYPGSNSSFHVDKNSEEGALFTDSTGTPGLQQLQQEHGSSSPIEGGPTP